MRTIWCSSLANPWRPGTHAEGSVARAMIAASTRVRPSAPRLVDASRRKPRVATTATAPRPQRACEPEPERQPNPCGRRAAEALEQADPDPDRPDRNPDCECADHPASVGGVTSADGPVRGDPAEENRLPEHDGRRRLDQPPERKGVAERDPSTPARSPATRATRPMRRCHRRCRFRKPRHSWMGASVR